MRGFIAIMLLAFFGIGGYTFVVKSDGTNTEVGVNMSEVDASTAFIQELRRKGYVTAKLDKRSPVPGTLQATAILPGDKDIKATFQRRRTKKDGFKLVKLTKQGRPLSGYRPSADYLSLLWWLKKHGYA